MNKCPFTGQACPGNCTLGRGNQQTQQPTDAIGRLQELRLRLTDLWNRLLHNTAATARYRESGTDYPFVEAFLDAERRAILAEAGWIQMDLVDVFPQLALGLFGGMNPEDSAPADHQPEAQPENVRGKFFLIITMAPVEQADEEAAPLAERRKPVHNPHSRRQRLFAHKNPYGSHRGRGNLTAHTGTVRQGDDQWMMGL